MSGEIFKQEFIDGQNEGDPMTRRNFLKQVGVGVVGLAIGSEVLQGCAPPPSWSLFDKSADSSDVKQEDAEMKIKKILENNRKKHDESDKLDGNDLRVMYKELVMNIPGFDKHIAIFKKKAVETMVDLKNHIPSLVYVMGINDERNIMGDSSIVQELPFPREELNERLMQSFAKVAIEVEEKLYRYIESMFSWSGALYDENKLKNMMDVLVGANFSMSKLMNLFIAPGERRDIYSTIFEMLRSKKFNDPFLSYGVLFSVIAMGKMFFEKEDSNFMQKISRNLVTAQTFQENSGNLWVDKFDEYGLDEVFFPIPAYVMSRGNLPIDEKLKMLSGRGDWNKNFVEKTKDSSMFKDLPYGWNEVMKLYLQKFIGDKDLVGKKMAEESESITYIDCQKQVLKRMATFGLQNGRSGFENSKVPFHKQVAQNFKLELLHTPSLFKC